MALAYLDELVTIPGCGGALRSDVGRGNPIFLVVRIDILHRASHVTIGVWLQFREPDVQKQKLTGENVDECQAGATMANPGRL